MPIPRYASKPGSVLLLLAIRNDGTTNSGLWIVPKPASSAFKPIGDGFSRPPLIRHVAALGYPEASEIVIA